jgi:ATP adenylyltransferase/5',5'''-P-1,P-4-tetraphosphate phosphorylase II
LKDHALLVTDKFAAQLDPLTASDLGAFHALVKEVMSRGDGLPSLPGVVFFLSLFQHASFAFLLSLKSSPESVSSTRILTRGASQPHRHMQAVPLDVFEAMGPWSPPVAEAKKKRPRLICFGSSAGSFFQH